MHDDLHTCGRAVVEFLYNPNRLIVATSRAKYLAWVVGGPALFAPECRTVRQMALANGFSRVAEEG